MSRKVRIAEALGNIVAGVSGRKDTMNGEPGETITVYGHNGRKIDVFFADNRKVKDQDAVRIVRSYLHRIGIKHDHIDRRYDK